MPKTLFIVFFATCFLFQSDVRAVEMERHYWIVGTNVEHINGKEISKNESEQKILSSVHDQLIKALNEAIISPNNGQAVTPILLDIELTSPLESVYSTKPEISGNIYMTPANIYNSIPDSKSLEFGRREESNIQPVHISASNKDINESGKQDIVEIFAQKIAATLNSKNNSEK